MVSNGQFIAYYRVSTAKQGRSGLGIEAQQAAVERYLNGGNWKVVESFTEVESGRNSERPALAKALAAARVRQVPIVVAKVDRLTRSVGFLSMLLDAGVDVRFADLPQIEGTAGRFMLKQMALVAELEAGFISDRTKAALAAAKRRGNAKAAAARAADLAPVIAELQASGAASLRAIASALNDRGIPTARGGKWFAASVRDVLARI
jgi:DNA invertase Pin-like site-specific DNA recombinase